MDIFIIHIWTKYIIKHTYKVVNKSEYIAKGLELNKENIELTKVLFKENSIRKFLEKQGI